MRHPKLLMVYVAALTLISSLLPICQAQTRSATILGSRYEVPPEEIALCKNVTEYIRNMIALYGSAYARFYYYGSGTTWANIMYAAAGHGYNYSISFYVGHEENETIAGAVQYFIFADNGEKAHDKDIYIRSTNRYVRFVFLWSCLQGNTIGGMHPSGTAYGMPNACS